MGPVPLLLLFLLFRVSSLLNFPCQGRLPGRSCVCGQLERFLERCKGAASYITLFQLRFVDYSLSYSRVFEDVLTDFCFHLEDCGANARFGGRIVGAVVCRTIALGPSSFPHVCVIGVCYVNS